MENYKDQLAHLKEMRNIMERSSRFFSLSGLSGILIGIYSLISSYFAYMLLFARIPENYDYDPIILQDQLEIKLLILAVLTFIVSAFTVILLSKLKANKTKETIWNSSSKLMIWNLLIPLIVGGCFGLICIYKGWVGIVAPITLIFYGLALINASKFTFGDIQWLGCIECLLGLISLMYIGYGLIFWAIGFGLMHIIYGTLIYFKYERTGKNV